MADLSRSPSRSNGQVRLKAPTARRTAEPSRSQTPEASHRQYAHGQPAAADEGAARAIEPSSPGGGSSQAGLAAARRLVRWVPSSPPPGEKGSPFNPEVPDSGGPVPERLDPSMITSRDVPKNRRAHRGAATSSRPRAVPGQHPAQDQAVGESPRGRSGDTTPDDDERLSRHAYGATLLAQVGAVVHPPGSRTTTGAARPSGTALDRPEFEQPETSSAAERGYDG